MPASIIVAKATAAALQVPPAPKTRHSIASAEHAGEGRRKIYRHWKFTDSLLETLDPAVLFPLNTFWFLSNKEPQPQAFRIRSVWDIALTMPLPDRLAHLAAISQGLFNVSIYDTLGPSAAEFIVNHSQLACVTSEQIGGNLGDKQYNPPLSDDIIMVNYTSGTTGDPKGVVLTRRTAFAAASSAMLISRPGDDDVICSYLPLAHIYRRVTKHVAFWSGSAIGNYHSGVVRLGEDTKLLRPTTFTGVPRLYHRFASAIKAASVDSPGIGGALSRQVIAVKTANIAKGLTNKYAFYDRVWSGRIASRIGFDRCVTLVSAAAHLDPSPHMFLSAVFANKFIQAYGLRDVLNGLVSTAGRPVFGHLWSSRALVRVDISDDRSLYNILNHTRIHEAAGEWLEGVARDARLNSFEKIRAFKLTVDRFTAENNLVTPT
ncbi:hypothetical protein B0J15DRAFT_472851 [Fusarium solani]|uniref:AMP-dependent synthetase/ligase domain-containing protein n=1 Tax=Fusarium solani TaxID=169388 RepID=A0A9P9JRT4_FUSSL|nr:uncharacterized protein B0J15DRAFT_472851 [Fusarium solani]KAH7230846.1 hypothetical protein B0J15DRAFT_472851 [Fusarium solani]